MKLVGKPDAGNRHVRFDERGQETKCCHMAQATAPVLDSTRRRDFITLLGGVAAWPLAARAQQAKKIPRIGVLWPNPPATFDFMSQGLKDFGYVEGQNIAFEFQWAEGKLDQLPELAADLVRLQVDVIVTLAPQATLAAKRATQTIPIVFVAMGDPIASGVVPSLARPGANLTGTTRMLPEMSAKHVELLKETVPSLTKLAVLWNPTNSSHQPALRAVHATAQSLSLQVQPLEVRAADELDGTFDMIIRERADCVLLHPAQAHGRVGRIEPTARDRQLYRISETRWPHGLCAQHPG